METSYRPKGFVNSRNACFLNAAMQLLGAMDALRTHVVESAGPFSDAFKESLLVTNLLEPASAFWQVTELFLGYTPRVIRQNCAAEFIRFFLGGLDHELAERFPKQASQDEDWLEAGKRNIQQAVNFVAEGRSALYDMLGLCLKTELRVKAQTSVTFQNELIISIKAEPQLITGLANALKPTPPEDYKERGLHTRCDLNLQVAGFSPFLIIHIQRFAFEGGRTTKISRHVAFPPQFTIPEKLLTHSLRLKVRNQELPPPTYTLEGLIEHHGKSANIGHYTCVLRSGQSWVLIDDQIVKYVTPKVVSERQAYVLLYKRVS